MLKAFLFLSNSIVIAGQKHSFYYPL